METSWIDLGAAETPGRPAATDENVPSWSCETPAPSVVAKSSLPTNTVSAAIKIAEETSQPFVSAQRNYAEKQTGTQFATSSAGKPYAAASSGGSYAFSTKSSSAYAAGSTGSAPMRASPSSGPGYASAQPSTQKFVETSHSPPGKEYAGAFSSYDSRCAPSSLRVLTLSCRQTGYSSSGSSPSSGYTIQAKSTSPYASAGSSPVGYATSF